jgi:hypothetical protein
VVTELAGRKRRAEPGQVGLALDAHRARVGVGAGIADPGRRGKRRQATVFEFAGNPNRCHEERSDIAKDISDLARSLAPRGPEQRTVKVDVTDSRTGRTVTGSMVVNGRRVMVQRRAAFAISSGYQPVKKP